MRINNLIPENTEHLGGAMPLKQKKNNPLEISELFKIVVELEGVEPSSKQGNHTLSTCLFQTAVFVRQQDLDHQLTPYPQKNSPSARGCLRLFPIYLHRCTNRIRNHILLSDVSSHHLVAG